MDVWPHFVFSPKQKRWKGPIIPPVPAAASWNSEWVCLYVGVYIYTELAQAVAFAVYSLTRDVCTVGFKVEARKVFFVCAWVQEAGTQSVEKLFWGALGDSGHCCPQKVNFLSSAEYTQVVPDLTGKVPWELARTLDLYSFCGCTVLRITPEHKNTCL